MRAERQREVTGKRVAGHVRTAVKGGGAHDRATIMSALQFIAHLLISNGLSIALERSIHLQFRNDSQAKYICKLIWRDKGLSDLDGHQRTMLKNSP